MMMMMTTMTVMMMTTAMTIITMTSGRPAREGRGTTFGFGRRQRPAAHAGHRNHNHNRNHDHDDDDEEGEEEVYDDGAGVHAVGPDPQPDGQDLGPGEDAGQQEGGPQEDGGPAADRDDQQVEYSRLKFSLELVKSQIGDQVMPGN